MGAVTRILFSLQRSGGDLEADGAEKLVEVVDDALIEAVKLGLSLLL